MYSSVICDWTDKVQHFKDDYNLNPDPCYMEEIFGGKQLEYATNIIFRFVKNNFDFDVENFEYIQRFISIFVIKIFNFILTIKS